MAGEKYTDPGEFMRVYRTTICAAVLALAGCGGWHYTVNAPLERHDPERGYRFTHVQAGDNSDELFIAVTFSGGGMRAAASPTACSSVWRPSESACTGATAGCWTRSISSTQCPAAA
jgi:hypothetical protein